MGGDDLSEMLLALMVKLGKGWFLALRLLDTDSLWDALEALIALKIVQVLRSFLGSCFLFSGLLLAGNWRVWFVNDCI